jgi:multiple sugar transport system substrate-binding protein
LYDKGIDTPLDRSLELSRALVADLDLAIASDPNGQSRIKGDSSMWNSGKGALAFITALGVAGVLAGCSGSGGDEDGGGGEDQSITVWTLEGEPYRLEIARNAAADFTEKTGIEVEFVATEEEQLPQLITAAAAAGDLPDVVAATPLSPGRIMSANGLVNTEAHAQVIENLGEDTFAPAALELTRNEGDQVAIPSDGFPMLIFYRTDLFEAAGLPAPETYEDLTNAAKVLDSPEVAGFVGGDAAIYFAQQSFELVALANDCELVDEGGEVTIDSPQCAEAFDLYGGLVRDYSVPGAMDTTTTREVYSAGDAAITIWASFYLDELAGMVADIPTTCDQCADDPAYLAKNSGVLTSLKGPSGDEPATVGEVTSFVITADANVEASTQFVEYFMSDGYLDWLSQAPEGKLPTRLGTSDNPTEYVDAWQDLETGVDTKGKLADFYSPEVIDEILGAAANFERWGFRQGQGDLLGGVVAELPISNAIANMKGGEGDGQAAAESVAESVRAIQGTTQ